MPMRPALFLVAALGGCALSSGIRPVGPDAYTVSEVRAPVRGGGAEAERVVLAEATSFCQAQGRVFAPIAMTPAGNPYGLYGPSGFDATFRCLPPQTPAPTAPAAGSPEPGDIPSQNR
jgi:hypothetical protein